MDWDHDYTGNNAIACDTSLATITDVNDFLNCRAHCEGLTGANRADYFSLSMTGGCCCKRNAQGRTAAPGFVSGELRCDTTGRIRCNKVGFSSKTKIMPSYTVPWRHDQKCGPNNPNSAGNPAECDPSSSSPCCSGSWCGDTALHCTCPGCTDYRTTGGDCLPSIAHVIAITKFYG